MSTGLLIKNDQIYRVKYACAVHCRRVSRVSLTKCIRIHSIEQWMGPWGILSNLILRDSFCPFQCRKTGFKFRCDFNFIKRVWVYQKVQQYPNFLSYREQFSIVWVYLVILRNTEDSISLLSQTTTIDSTN